MSYTNRKRSFKKGSDDKYLRLTGLWPSKNKDGLWTGRFRAEDMEKLLAKVNEAGENDAPLVFSLWETTEKESRKDPDFSLQCFVGDNEEKPASKSRFCKKKAEPEDDEEDEEEEESEEEEEEEEDEKPKGKTKTKAKARAKW